MEPNELRIGVLHQKEVIKEDCTTEKIIFRTTDTDIRDSFFYRSKWTGEPIPITEEWLLKFGFEKIIYDSEETGYGIDYHLKVNDDIFISMSDDWSLALYASRDREKRDYGVLPKPTKYIHQLQNLYYALTGEELQLRQ